MDNSKIIISTKHGGTLQYVQGNWVGEGKHIAILTKDLEKAKRFASNVEAHQYSTKLMQQKLKFSLEKYLH